MLTVMVMLLLGLGLVLSTYHLAKLTEMILGNTSDYQRSFAAAEALLRDAELDIRTRRAPDPAQPSSRPWFPQSSDDFDSVADLVSTRSKLRCWQGICMPQAITPDPDIPALVANIQTAGACYGQFTQPPAPGPAMATDNNPVLRAGTGNGNCQGARAWYWVEAFRYGDMAHSGANHASQWMPEPSRNFVYRITAVTRGLRDGTQVILQSHYVPYPAIQNQ